MAKATGKVTAHRVCVYFDDVLYQRLVKGCDADERSGAYIIRRAVREYFDREDKVKTSKR